MNYQLSFHPLHADTFNIVLNMTTTVIGHLPPVEMIIALTCPHG